jgi:DNA-binding beta-propeller fold protein YncE
MKTTRTASTFATLALGALVAACGPAAQAQPLYQLESALTIKSPNPPNWDYLTFDPARSFVYIARREDGILIYDTKAKKVVGTIDNTHGGNSTTLVPALDRAFVTNEDGTLTVVQLSTLKSLDRVKVGESADNAFFDAVTGQLLVTQGDDSQAVFVDAKTAKVVGSLHVDSESLEGTVADGQGNFFMALRDRDKVIKIDARQRKLLAEYRVDGCHLPNSVGFDSANKRVLVTCRGEHPILAVLDTDGHTLSSTAIGRGNDVMIFDPQARKVYTANGFDGTLVILQQVDSDHYRLAEAVTTRPYARTMALDPGSKKVYMVCAEGTVEPARKWKSEIAPFYPNKYFLDTFTLLTYAPK